MSRLEKIRKRLDKYWSYPVLLSPGEAQDIEILLEVAEAARAADLCYKAEFSVENYDDAIRRRPVVMRRLRKALEKLEGVDDASSIGCRDYRPGKHGAVEP